MSENKKTILYGAIAGAVILSFMIWTGRVQEEVGKNSRKPTEGLVETPTPTEEPVVIAIVDGLPTAVAYTSTPAPKIEPTDFTEPTSTPTMAPTATETPKKPTNTPKPSKSPTPTPKAKNTAKYEQGTAGTKYAEVNGKHGWKPWARHTAVTDKSSPQWRLEQIATTDALGRRVVTDRDGVERFLVALPVYWAGGTFSDIGRLVDITMANGATLKCVLADIKQIEHSLNGEGKYGSRGELIEVICEKAKLIPAVGKGSDASRFGAEWEGDVYSVTAYDEFIEGFGGR